MVSLAKKNLILLILATVLVTSAPIAHAQKSWDDKFTFVRIQYNMGEFGMGFRFRYGNQSSWRVDYPSADENFLLALARGTYLPIEERALSFSLDNEELFDFPFAYLVEAGYMQLTQEEADFLREWLLRGGFLFIDDFHGPREWANFIEQFQKVFSDRTPREIPMDHPIFHCYYDFEGEFPQVPGLGSILRGTTFEKGGVRAECKGIFDDQGRLMVLVNHNVDLGDSWEHTGDYSYPRYYSILGYKLGINYIVYSLTH